MQSIKHINSKSVDETVSLLKEANSAILAGGTDLLGTIKDEVHLRTSTSGVFRAQRPELLINIKTISGLDYITEEKHGLRIGATTKLHDLARHPVVRKKYTALAEAAQGVATPQIRRMATIAGNICQEPRCWYYRYPDNRFDCIRKGGEFCSALVGENRYHSVYGGLRVHTTPCEQDCPAGTHIPKYLSSIRSENYHQAALTLLESNPIAAVTGRVCPHFCQQGCNRCELDEAVGIRNIERFMGDYILEHWDELVHVPVLNGKKVAVIGAGPAGLAAAFYLRRMGNNVVVYDRFEKAGGMLIYAIPAYRLPRQIVARIVEQFESLGIQFKQGVEIGKDISFEEIRAGFDAVFIATGTWKRPSIGLDGESLTEYGLDFLRRISVGEKVQVGKTVVVIGGGAVAVDVAISALRLGAKKVSMVSLESREEMPAYEWEVDQAIEEKVELMPGWGPQRVITQGGAVTGIELVKCTAVFDENGRFSPVFDRSIKTQIPTDHIIMAVGQRSDLSYASEVKIERGRVLVDKETQQTNLAGVYAGGDIEFPGSIIEAVADGRRAAYAIDASLRGVALNIPGPDIEEEFLTIDESCPEKGKATQPAVLPVSERSILSEDIEGLNKTQVIQETLRCMNCSCVAVSPSDLAPALIALDATIHTTARSMPAEEFFTAGIGSSTVLEKDEMVKEIEIPAPREGSRSSYVKLRLRQSIDFPIIGLAVQISEDGNGEENPRLVLGAAAPIPLRLKETEAFLAGKRITESIASEAADLALKGTSLLACNAYKLQIIKTLVRRALLPQ